VVVVRLSQPEVQNGEISTVDMNGTDRIVALDISVVIGSKAKPGVDILISMDISLF
jgi:hypothetical protein